MNARDSWIGPVFLIAGAAAGLVSGATHGDLPEDSGAAALQFVADHPAYALVHVTAILGAVLWALGLSSWRPGGAGPSAQWLAAAAGRTALVGTAILAVQFTLDGIGLPALAALWSRPDAQPETFEAIAEIAPEALIGDALIWVILLYGLTPILAGASLLLTARRVLGWTGLALGGFATVGGILLALGIDVVPDWLVFAGATIGVNLWLIALGVSTVRRTPTAGADSPHRLDGHRGEPAEAGR